MKVSDYERDMILGQKYLIEVEYHIQDPDSDMDTIWYTYSDEVGKTCKNHFSHDEVDYFRALHGSIYIHIHRFINSIDDVVAGYDDV